MPEERQTQEGGLDMAKYIVFVEEITYHQYEVEADSKEDAMNEWDSGTYIGWLDSEWGAYAAEESKED